MNTILKAAYYAAAAASAYADIIYYEDSNGNVEDNRPKTCEDKIIEIEKEKK